MSSESQPTPTAEPSTPAPKVLGAADLRAHHKDRPRRVEEVSLPELGGSVYVRHLTALEKDRLDDALTDEKGKPVADNVRAKVFAACACDADGKPNSKNSRASC